MPKLENWSMRYSEDTDPYQAPETIACQLAGTVYGHERFKDGELITTSSVRVLDLPHKLAVTRNTRYDLGTPDPLWVEWLDKNGHNMLRNKFPGM